ncbi:MAG: hypothetical protein MUC59_03070, partial [Saprospiraceae bacterium]|nr:hypothetical protein [Saprospiraceae bacterium]
VMAYNDGAVSDAMVQLVEVPTGEAVPPSDASNRHFFIKPNKQYQVAVSAPGFSTETLDLETTPNDALSVIQRKVGLRQSAKLVVQAFSALDSLPLRDVDFTYSNEKGPQPLTNQNTSKAADYSFQVAFGDKSKLVATKPGYQPAVVNLDLPNGNGPSPVLNLDVYLQPFAVLPISLYFDNDQPKWPNPTDNEQNLTYEQTLNEYLARKPIFVEKYTEGLAQNAYETARQQMLSFFDKDVAQGMQALNELCAQIEPYLKKGYRLEMLTEGEASPLASFDYNKQLSERRLSSIRNYLKVWNNGALKSYLYSGHLTLSTKFVQQKMPADTATEPVLAADRRQVEFSPASSLMRKIVIREVRLQNKV